MTNPIVAMLQKQIGKEGAQNAISPVAKYIGGIMRVVESGEITIEYLVKKEHSNPTGGIHGGVVSLLMDEVIGIAVFSMNNDYLFTSINLSVNFLSSAKVGDTILVTAKVVRKGRKVIYVESDITKLDGKVIARSSSNMTVTPVKNPWKQG